MQKKDKYLVIIVFFIVTTISIILTFNWIKILKDIKGNPKNIAYTSLIKNNTDYEVYIKNNPYIEENVLSSNNSYLTTLVNNIIIKYNYEKQYSKSVNLKYNYKVIATIVGNDAQYALNNFINKEYILLKSGILTGTNEISIDENVEIDLSNYNLLVDKFITEFAFNPNINLEVKLLVNIQGKINKKVINNDNQIIVTIPLGVKIFDIVISDNFDEQETIYLGDLPDKEKSYVIVILLIVCTLIVIGSGVYISKKIIEKYKSKYILAKNKIIKEYDDRIVEVTNFVKYTSWETVDVKSIKELVKFATEAFEPIFFWEHRVNRKKEAWFCILKEKVMYRYTLKNE